MKPADLRKPKNISGYAHVGKVAGPSRTSPPYFQAYANGGRKGDWKGPARQTAEEAAQDYCDYLAGKGIQPRKRPGNTVPRDPIDDREVQAALGVLRDARAQRRKLAQGYVYLIGDGTAVKVGYSVKPAARVAELQTGNPRTLRLLGMFKGTEEDEAAVHQRFMEHNILLEWFVPSEALYNVFGLSFDKEGGSA